MSNPPLDSRQFRNALGAFATGVTIVTTRAADGAPVGLTASSFNSLSLDPPMVLWALARTSRNLPAFTAADYFAVHVLAADQQPLATRFATRGGDRFAALEFDAGPAGIPLLRGCSARFQCRTVQQHAGGDHVIFVGEVLEFDHFDRPPLAFQGGLYASVVRRPPASARTAEPAVGSDGSFSRDFLGYLLGSAHARLMARVRGALERHRLAEEHYHVLMLLSNTDNLTLAELATLTLVADRHVTYETLAMLAIRDLITVTGGNDPAARARLTPEGHRVALEVGVALKAAEAHAERFLGANEAQALKVLLRGILAAMPPAAAPLASDEH